MNPPTWIEPKIETGYDCPAPKRKYDRRRQKRPSPWPAFLGKLEPFKDSFKIEYPCLQTVKNHAARLGMDITWEDAKDAGGQQEYGGGAVCGMRLARVWRIK